MLSSFHVLIVPGWNNSGPTHWQSRWQSHLPNTSRVRVCQPLADRFTLLKSAGHINADTPLGLWDEGLCYLDRLVVGAYHQAVA